MHTSPAKSLLTFKIVKITDLGILHFPATVNSSAHFAACVCTVLIVAWLILVRSVALFIVPQSLPLEARDLAWKLQAS